MTGLGRGLGIALGVLLSATVFLRWRWAAPHAAPHMDHAPRHGGILGMVGDHHLEIVRAPARVECHPSDAVRRPLQAVGGQVECAGAIVAGRIAGAALFAAVDCSDGDITCEVKLSDGVVLRMSARPPGEAVALPAAR